MRLILRDLIYIAIAGFCILALGEVSELLTSVGAKDGAGYLFVTGLIVRWLYFILLVSLLLVAPCWLGMSVYTLLFRKHTKRESHDPKI